MNLTNKLSLAVISALYFKAISFVTLSRIGAVMPSVYRGRGALQLCATLMVIFFDPF